MIIDIFMAYAHQRPKAYVARASVKSTFLFRLKEAAIMVNGKRVRVAAAGLLLVTLVSGCHVIQTAADVPGQAIRTVTPVPKAEPTVDPVEVQQNLMRFADEFTARMLVGVEKLRRGTNTLSIAENLRWKIAIGTAACSIASGQNAVANVLDMTVFVTETRMSLEEYWQPKVFGESAQALLESCRKAETEIWTSTDNVLKPNQQAALREAIQAWHRQSSPADDLLVVRAVGLAAQVAHANRADITKPGSVFSLLMLDPLAELDPTRREIAQTRLFAERALYVTQKMPTLLRWQTELLSVNTLELPAAQQWASNVTQIAVSVDRFTRAAEQVPRQFSAEREELLKALQSQEGALTPVLVETKQMFATATELSASLNTTLNTFNGVLKRLGVDDTEQVRASQTNSTPFRVQDYGQAAAQLEAAAKQLTLLLETFDQTLGANSRSKLAAQIDPVVQQAQVSGKSLVDYAFRKGVLFVAVVLLAALLYLFVAACLNRTTPRNKS